MLWPGGRTRDCHVAGRLKREEGATLFRLRWCASGPHHVMARQPTAIRHLTTKHIHFIHIFGVVCRYGLSPMDLNSVYVERKTHHEKWTQQRSQKDRPHHTSCISPPRDAVSPSRVLFALGPRYTTYYRRGSRSGPMRCPRCYVARATSTPRREAPHSQS